MLFINRWIILQRPASNSDPFDPKGVLPFIACRCCSFVDFQGLGLLKVKRYTLSAQIKICELST